MREFFLQWALEKEIKQSPDSKINIVEKDGTPICGYSPNKWDGILIEVIAK